MSPRVSAPHAVLVSTEPVRADDRVLRSAGALVRAGLRVTVVAPRTRDDAKREPVGGVDVVRVRVRGDLSRVAPRRAGAAGDAGARALETARGHGRARARKLLRDQNRRTAIAEVRAGLADDPSPLRRVRGWSRIYLVRGLMRADARVWRMRAGRRSRRAERARSGRRPWRRGRPDWRRELPAVLDFELAAGPLLDRLGADVVHAFGPGALVAATNAAALAGDRAPRVVYDCSIDASGDAADGRPGAGALARLEEEHIGLAGAVVTSSPVLAATLRRRYELAGPPKLVLDAPAPAPAPAAPAHGVGPAAPDVRAAARVAPAVPLLVMVGPIPPGSEAGLAIRALAVLPLATLALVVPDPRARSTQAVVRLATTLDCVDRVRVLPRPPAAALPAYLGGADAVVHEPPLTPTGRAALPFEVLAAIHAGVPLVTPAGGAVGGLVERHGLGALHAPRDVDDLVQACQQVLAAGGQAAAAGPREKLLADLSWPLQARRLVTVYQGLGAARVRRARAAVAA